MCIALGTATVLDNTVIDSKDDADDFSVDFSCNAGVIDIESPVLSRWYGPNCRRSERQCQIRRGNL